MSSKPQISRSWVRPAWVVHQPASSGWVPADSPPSAGHPVGAVQAYIMRQAGRLGPGWAMRRQASPTWQAKQVVGIAAGDEDATDTPLVQDGLLHQLTLSVLPSLKQPGLLGQAQGHAVHRSARQGVSECTTKATCGTGPRKQCTSYSLSRWPSLDCQLKGPVLLDTAWLMPSRQACLLQQAQCPALHRPPQPRPKRSHHKGVPAAGWAWRAAAEPGGLQ